MVDGWRVERRERGEKEEDLDVKVQEEVGHVEGKVDETEEGHEERVVLEGLGDKSLERADDEFERQAKVDVRQQADGRQGERNHEQKVECVEEAGGWVRDGRHLKQTEEWDGDGRSEGAEAEVDQAKDTKEEEERQKTRDELGTCVRLGTSGRIPTTNRAS